MAPGIEVRVTIPFLGAMQMKIPVLTGFKDFDRMTEGFRPGDLVCIGSRPGGGKTAIGLRIAEHLAIRQQKPVIYFSLELSKDRITERLVSAATRISLTNIRTGFLTQKERPAVASAKAIISSAPLHIIDTPCPSVSTIRAASLQISSKLRTEGRELGLIVVDFFQ